MPARRHEPEVVTASTAVNLRRVSSWRGIRVLAWDRDALFGCRGYQLVCLQTVQLPQAGKRRVGAGGEVSTSVVEKADGAVPAWLSPSARRLSCARGSR